MVIKILLSKIAFVVGIFAGVNGLFLLMAMIWNYKNKRVRMEQTPELEQLRKHCKDFHFGKFVEDLEYKLKTIYFAEKQEDISLFAKDDVMKKHVLYDNVLDSELRSCRIIGYEQDDRYHFIEVETIQTLTLLQGKRIVEKEARLHLKFRKSRAAHASESLVSYSCGGCGSSVNLLNGGVCDYCGQQLNLEEYDWLLVGYKSMGIKRNDAVRFYTRLLAGLFCAVILLANRSELHIVTVAAKCCFEDMTTSVYVYKDEMIPSLENYGYAIACDVIEEEENKIEYRYSFVDGRSHVMSDYPLHLVEDCEFVMMAVSSVSMSRTRNVFVKFGSDWPQVQVTIDDVSFSYTNYKRISDTRKEYHYIMNRILYYTYDGKEYEVEDTVEYVSTDKNYQVELRKNYTDHYIYQVNPENPSAVMKSYSSLADTDAMGTVDMFSIAIPLIFLVVMDLAVLMNGRNKKKKIFD